MPEAAPDLREIRLKIPKVFLPGTAIRTYDFFRGREGQMTKAIGIVYQPGRHILLYGERGVGKTSLAKVLVDTQHNDGYWTLKTQTMNCDPSDDFTSLWRKVFRVMPYTEHEGKLVNLDEVLPDGELVPDDVREALSNYQNPVLIALDEVDQLKDPDARTLLAATVKTLSDQSENVTLMLIGVAQTADELIEEHRSIIRSLVPIQMPRMSSAEIHEIVNGGLKILGMTIDENALRAIALLARGFPYYAHSFGLHGGLRAVDGKRLEITREDVFAAAADVALDAVDIHTAYSRATTSPQSSSKHDMALLACALTQTDEQGYFSAGSIQWPLSVLLDKTIDIPRYNHYLEEFCQDRRGKVLEVIGERNRKRNRFSDSLMQPYVIINSFGTGKLDIRKMLKVLKVELPPEDVEFTDEGS